MSAAVERSEEHERQQELKKAPEDVSEKKSHETVPEKSHDVSISQHEPQEEAISEKTLETKGPHEETKEPHEELHEEPHEESKETHEEPREESKETHEEPQVVTIRVTTGLKEDETAPEETHEKEAEHHEEAKETHEETKESHEETTPAKTHEEPQEEAAPVTTHEETKESHEEATPAKTHEEPHEEATPTKTHEEPQEETTHAKTHEEPQEEAAPATTHEETVLEAKPHEEVRETPTETVSEVDTEGKTREVEPEEKTQEVEEKGLPGPGELKAEVQERPEGVGIQREMESQPISDKLESEQAKCSFDQTCLTDYKASGRLLGRKALITGGDSGIGRAVALFFAKEGADVAIGYLPVEQKDAEDTRDLISKFASHVEGKEKETIVELLPMDIQVEENCQQLIQKTISKLGGIDLLVNNAAYQTTQLSIEEMTSEQLERTFRTNVFGPVYLCKHAVPHMPEGSSIIFSTSVVAYKGHEKLVDYAASKAAEVGLVRSLALQLSAKGIRVNGVAPGPVWTPLQPISRSEEDMEQFTQKKPLLGRIAQPSEIAPTYVFLASDNGAQYTGQVLHPNCGVIVGS